MLPAAKVWSAIYAVFRTELTSHTDCLPMLVAFVTGAILQLEASEDIDPTIAQLIVSTKETSTAPNLLGYFLSLVPGSKLYNTKHDRTKTHQRRAQDIYFRAL